MSKGKASPQERRQTKRLPAPKDTFCYLKIKGDKVVGPFKIQNLSRGGATLVLDPSLAHERVQAVHLYNKARRCWSEHEIQIAYLFLIPHGFTVGVTFNRDLSDPEVQEFL